jgi:hypothetical protein
MPRQRTLRPARTTNEKPPLKRAKLLVQMFFMMGQTPLIKSAAAIIAVPIANAATTGRRRDFSA